MSLTLISLRRKCFFFLSLCASLAKLGSLCCKQYWMMKYLLLFKIIFPCYGCPTCGAYFYITLSNSNFDTLYRKIIVETSAEMMTNRKTIGY